MPTRDAWGGMRRIAEEQPELVASVLEEVRERGPIAASELSHERPRRSGPWWDWSEDKRALEYLFWSGQVSSARRRRFERLYDLTERVLPAKVLAVPTPEPEEAQRELLRIATRSLGRCRRGRPSRVLPPHRRRGQAPLRRARRGRGADPGRGRGLGPHARLPRPRRADPQAGRCAGAARALRLTALGPPARAANLWLRVPARDLRP